MLPLITHIQKYSLHNGKGIRTTIFFKGCPLHCAWCHNPETQSYQPQLFYDVERCVGCLNCMKSCNNDAILPTQAKVQRLASQCTFCGNCTTACLMQLRNITGKYYTIDDLVELVMKDSIFYEQSDGGITLSGGEVMTQHIPFVKTLMHRLYQECISINIDTCGYAPYENFEALLPYTDTFLYDIKLIDADKHFKYTKVDNQLILENLIRLSRQGAKIILRIPVIVGVNANHKDMQDIVDWLITHQINSLAIHLLPYHHTASSKYTQLGLSYHGFDFTAPNTQCLKQYSDLFRNAGITNIIIL